MKVNSVDISWLNIDKNNKYKIEVIQKLDIIFKIT